MKTIHTTFDVLLAVAAIGGQLGIAGENLRMLLPANAPQELKQAIRERKPELLGLLKLNFLVIDSATLDGTVIFTPDEATKETLVAAGADSSTIYTADELAVLICKRVTRADLPLIHTAKQQFKGRLTA